MRDNRLLFTTAFGQKSKCRLHPDAPEVFFENISFLFPWCILEFGLHINKIFRPTSRVKICVNSTYCVSSGMENKGLAKHSGRSQANLSEYNYCTVYGMMLAN